MASFLIKIGCFTAPVLERSVSVIQEILQVLNPCCTKIAGASPQDECVGVAQGACPPPAVHGPRPSGSGQRHTSWSAVPSLLVSDAFLRPASRAFSAVKHLPTRNRKQEMKAFGPAAPFPLQAETSMYHL